MAQQILHKRASTAAKVPLTTDLALGELAINTVDGKLFLKKNNGSDAIVEVGATTLTGDVTGSGNSSVATTLSNTGVVAGTYSKVTVDAKGRVSSGVNMSASDINTILGYTPENTSNKNLANGYAGLGSDGKLPTNLLPALAITDTFVVGSDAAMTALAAQTGDVAVRTDIVATYILKGSDPTVLANWQQLLSPVGSSNVSSVNNKTGSVTLTTSDITEGSNLYHTDARSVAAPLTGFAVGSNASIAAADTVLGAFGKVQAQLNAKAASGANSDITSLSGLTTALSIAQGGTGATTAAGVKTNLVLDKVENKASQDIRNDITSADVTRALSYTPLSLAGGNLTGNLVFANNTGLFFKDSSGNAHQTLVYSTDNNLYLNMPSGGTWNFMATGGSLIAHMDNSGNLTANSFVGNASTASSAAKLTGPAYTNGTDGWFRSSGVTGWYNADYGVGIYASEIGNVRTYNNSSFISNNITAAGVYRGGSGSPTNPTYGFSNDTDTGFYSEGDGYLDITVNGAYRGRFDGSGNLGITGSFYGSGANLTGYGASFTAGNTNSISSALWATYTWTAAQYFNSNIGYNGLTGHAGAAPCTIASSDNGPAFMTFWRQGTSAYAVQFGLDYDNVFRMGGWSAGSIYSWDMSGNFTAAGNITAYSDERIKTNWRDVRDDFIERWAELKSGTFDRIDTGETQVGLPAQGVRDILPHAVMEDKDGMLSLNYGGAAGVATVKLAQRVLELEAMVEALMKKIG